MTYEQSEILAPATGLLVGTVLGCAVWCAILAIAILS